LPAAGRRRSLDGIAAITGPKSGTSFGIGRCFDTSRRRAFATSGIEGIMATRQHGHIVENPTEARQAEPGPSVLALLMVSTGLAVLILGLVWFVFFHT
jgi:hypothetical protein